MNPIFNMTLIAAADLSAKQYYAVKTSSAGKAAIAGAGEFVTGILQNTPELGQGGTIMVYGISKAIYGATVAAGAKLASNASGQLITAVVGDHVVGIALEAGSASEIHNILLLPGSMGVAYETISIPVNLATADDATLLTKLMEFAGSVVDIRFVVTAPTTDTTGKTCTITASIGGVAITGASVVLDTDVALADPDTIGKAVIGAATALNTFAAGGSLTLEVGDTAAPFTDGAGVVLITLKKTA